MKHITNEESHRAMGAFIIALGASMPKELAEKIASNLTKMSEQMIEHDDSPTVAMLCQGYAKAIVEPHTTPENNEIH
ncbi:MAG: hypothetical protein R8M45_00950 [Ghiorsea sp.]